MELNLNLNLERQLIIGVVVKLRASGPNKADVTQPVKAYDKDGVKFCALTIKMLTVVVERMRNVIKSDPVDGNSDGSNPR